jgi:hypothetical protein
MDSLNAIGFYGRRWEFKDMSEVALTLTCSVEANVTLAFAWQFRTDVTNWNDPPARFVLHGPFEAGSFGTTELPEQSPLRWRIADVRPAESFVVEMPLEQAMLTFHWEFDHLPGLRTRLTQQIVLSGENAAAYVTQVEAGLGLNLESGMKRIAAEMSAAERRARHDDEESASSRD